MHILNYITVSPFINGNHVKHHLFMQGHQLQVCLVLLHYTINSKLVKRGNLMNIISSYHLKEIQLIATMEKNSYIF